MTRNTVPRKRPRRWAAFVKDVNDYANDETDRKSRDLLVQKWTWIGKRPRKDLKRRIEEELHRFERFQLAE